MHMLVMIKVFCERRNNVGSVIRSSWLVVRG